MIFSRLFVALFICLWVAFPSFAETARKNPDFPPEAEYPEEANPDSQPDAEAKKGAAKKKGKEGGVEKIAIGGTSSSPQNWNKNIELVMGLNQNGSSADPNRSTVGTSSAFLIGGRASLFRKKWGIEIEPRYSFSPDQTVITGSDTLTRTLSTLSILIGGTYRFAADSLSGSRYSFFAKAGYALNSVKVTEVNQTTTVSTPNSTQINGFYIGVAAEAQWNSYFNSSLELIYSLFPSGKMEPTNSVGSYSVWKIQNSNRVRLLGTDEADPTKYLGAGLILAYQSMGTPTPATGSLTGGSESQIHVLLSGFLAF